MRRERESKGSTLCRAHSRTQPSVSNASDDIPSPSSFFFFFLVFGMFYSSHLFFGVRLCVAVVLLSPLIISFADVRKKTFLLTNFFGGAESDSTFFLIYC
jgi:hypothetical protein